MGSLVVASVLSFTVAGALALGIALAYTSVVGLLQLFAPGNRKLRPAWLLIHSQTQISGD